MILVRNVFRLEFGRSREALALMREGVDIMRAIGVAGEPRLMTDLTGPFYTLVLEVEFADLATMEREVQKEFADERWRAWYERFIPLARTGYRELFTIVAGRGAER